MTITEGTRVSERLTTDDARELTDRIKLKADALVTMIGTAWRGRADLALGYDSWDGYWDTEFGGLQLEPRDRDQRRELVSQMRNEGMSTPAIGGALGVSHQTVQRDLATCPDGQVQPDRVVGLDGKDRPAKRENPPPPPPPEDLLGGMDANPPADPYADWTDDEHALADRLRAGETVVVNMRNGAHDNLVRWADERAIFVRVDRRTEWGNPFETPADGDRATVIANYAEHYLPHKASLLGRLHELRGKALGCWCAPQACHADVLKARADR